MKGDMLTILQKNEDDWWMARNMAGVTGLVPSNYITKVSPRANSLSALLLPTVKKKL